MPFKVGDTVYPIHPTDPDCNRFIAWVSEMDQYAGRPATVTRVDTLGGQPVYIAKCAGGTADDEYYFLPDWLSDVVPEAPLEVGDFVHFRRPGSSSGKPTCGRVIGVGERKLAVWPDFYNACEPWFIDREWVVSESDA
jgi:hypothetical protein